MISGRLLKDIVKTTSLLNKYPSSPLESVKVLIAPLHQALFQII